MLARLLLSVLLCLAAIDVAPATTMGKMVRTCPIGGEKYDSFAIFSTSSFGIRLDLRRGGPAAHLPTPECPNGFVVYKDEKEFTPEEIATLTPLVASEAYQRLRGSHMLSYRTFHLLKALGAPEANLGWSLMQAAWEAEDAGDESLRQTYLSEAQPIFMRLREAGGARNDMFWMAHILVAEIARQQARFDEAAALLDAAPMKELADTHAVVEFARQIRARAGARDAKPAFLAGKGEPLR